MTKKSKRSHKTSVTISVVVILLAIAGGFYFFRHRNNPANLINDKGATTVKGTASKPTAPKLPTTVPKNSQIGGAKDNNGQVTGNLPNPSYWVSSDNGDITLQEPSPNATLQSGDSIVGTAKVNTVQFILTDNTVGLIAEGNLSVVNGKFSGTLSFIAHSSSGVLQVYYPNSNNGAEEDIIEINVKFSD
jgi:hypothetical protein